MSTRPAERGVCAKPCEGERDSMKCTAKKKDGTACGNRTARGDKCWIHLKKEDGLRIKESKHGLGLFTTETIEKGETIAPYTGEWVSKEELEKQCPGNTLMKYGIQVTKDKFLNACKTTDAPARFANDPRGSGKPSNARISVNARTKDVKLKAKQRIKPGTEITTSYGNQYWKAADAPAQEKGKGKEKEKEPEPAAAAAPSPPPSPQAEPPAAPATPAPATPAPASPPPQPSPQPSPQPPLLMEPVLGDAEFHALVEEAFPVVAPDPIPAPPIYGGKVTLGDSTIPGAGLGVFALVDLKKGELITFYWGKLVSHAEAKKLSKEERSHVRVLDMQHTAVDGKYLPDGTKVTKPKEQLQGVGIASMANHALGEGANSVFSEIDLMRAPSFLSGVAFYLGQLGQSKLVTLKAKRDIKKGEEVLVSYGRDYWK